MNVAILPALYCPPVEEHIDLIAKLSPKFDLVLLGVLVTVNSRHDWSWPEFVEDWRLRPMNYWESLCCIESCLPKKERWLNVAIAPMYCDEINHVIYESVEHIAGSERVWYVSSIEQSLLRAALVQRGEVVLSYEDAGITEVHYESGVRQGIAEQRHLGVTGVVRESRGYLEGIRFLDRLVNVVSTSKEAVMAGGQHFHGDVTVTGSILYIENQTFNISGADLPSTAKAIGEILRSSSNSDTQARAISEVGKQSQANWGEQEIVEATLEELRTEPQALSRAKLQEVYTQLTTGTSSSLLATCISKAIEYFLAC